jgi:phage terminase small subunit
MVSRQKIWLEEYLKTWNATEAAYRAGYANPPSAGGKLLAKPHLKAAIAERINERVMGANEVLVRLAEHARAEYSRYLRPNATVDLAAMERDGMLHLVKNFKHTRNGIMVEFHDVQAALLHIGRHHQLFTDKVNVSGEIELKEHASATERILSRIDSVAARLRAQSNPAEPRADGDGAGSA